MTVDLAPLGWLLLKAALIAAIPLALVLFSRQGDKPRRLAWLTAFLTLDLIVFGAFTRLTDSGLGCPDWPGCYGHSNPLSAGESIRAAESALPSGPVTLTKAWIEMLHRYFAMAVGALILALVAHAWWRRKNGSATSAWPASIALAAVCVQGAFGALTVTSKLQPLIVSLHLLGGMGLLALLVWLAQRESPASVVDASAARLRPWLFVSLFLLVVQIALGGWVSSNYAVLACAGFPTCQGSWWPEADFARGFTLWRELGRDGSGELIPFAALVAIHWVHRVFALLVVSALAVLVWRAWRIQGLEKPARGVLALLVLQVATGVSNVVMQWPLASALLHNGGAAALLAVLVLILTRCAQAARDSRFALEAGSMKRAGSLPRASASARLEESFIGHRP